MLCRAAGPLVTPAHNPFLTRLRPLCFPVSSPFPVWPPDLSECPGLRDACDGRSRRGPDRASLPGVGPEGHACCGTRACAQPSEGHCQRLHTSPPFRLKPST